MNNNNQSRREFLTRCAALGAAGIASPLASLGLMSSATAAATPPTQYRAMVCVYLIGGNDLNMLVPTDADNFGLYTNLRQKIALKQESLLAIESSQGGTSQSFGLHPACTGMQELYNKGNLAFVNNTGALIEPTTAEQFKTKSVKVPPKIFSHNSQKDFVQAGLPFAGEKLTGWAGRIADMYQSSGLTATMNFSFTGDNVWQRGETTKAYGMRGSKVIPAFSFRNNAGTNIASRKSILERINNLQSDHLITSEYGRIVKESINLSDGLREGAQVQEIELQTQFEKNKVGNLFYNTAKLINARNGLQMRQQNFHIVLGGWDHHANLLGRHAANLKQLDAGLSSLYKALEEMGLENQVTTFTNHDFGRTLSSNGTGSDHAWGGHQIVMGGKIDGGKVYGQQPIYSPDDPQFLDSRGALIPTTSTDQFSATIAQWFGDFSDSQLEELFPNLRNFNQNTLGFYKA